MSEGVSSVSLTAANHVALSLEDESATLVNFYKSPDEMPKPSPKPAIDAQSSNSTVTFL